LFTRFACGAGVKLKMKGIIYVLLAGHRIKRNQPNINLYPVKSNFLYIFYILLINFYIFAYFCSLQKIEQTKKQKILKKKQDDARNRRALREARVIQKNLGIKN
jgi:hypothetical protein